MSSIAAEIGDNILLSSSSVNHENTLDGDEIFDDVTSHVPASPSSGKSKKKRDGSTLRKAPQAPKRFKSSYILFFMAKQQEIKEELGVGASVGDVSKRSSQMWKNLSADEREKWDDVARQDKERYMNEKASYTGPWQVPWKRSKKDPSAPKRPMSAFLYFSQDKRRKIKESHPGMRNTEVSRVLGEMWKNAPEEERQPHIEREAKERAKYKIEIAKWRKEDEVRKEQEKKDQKMQLERAKLSATHHNVPYGQHAPILQTMENNPSNIHGHSHIHAQPVHQASPVPQPYYQSGGYSDSNYQSHPQRGYTHPSSYGGYNTYHVPQSQGSEQYQGYHPTHSGYGQPQHDASKSSSAQQNYNYHQPHNGYSQSPHEGGNVIPPVPVGSGYPPHSDVGNMESQYPDHAASSRQNHPGPSVPQSSYGSYSNYPQAPLPPPHQQMHRDYDFETGGHGVNGPPPYNDFEPYPTHPSSQPYSPVQP